MVPAQKPQAGAEPHAADPALTDAEGAAQEQSEDLFDFPLIVAFQDDQAAPPRRTPTIAGAEGGLTGDEDFFEFPSFERIAAPSRPAPRTHDSEELEEALDEAADSVAGLLGEEARRRRPRRAEGTSQSPPVVLAGGVSRPLWALASVALLLNAGIFLLLWQSSRSFEATLLEVRAERSASLPVSTPEAVTGEASPRPPAAASPLQLAPREATERLEAAEEIALRLALEELEDGRPVAARRRLFDLLATIDGVRPGRREAIESRAAFLVADTFRIQAQDAEEQTR